MNDNSETSSGLSVNSIVQDGGTSLLQARVGELPSPNLRQQDETDQPKVDEAQNSGFLAPVKRGKAHSLFMSKNTMKDIIIFVMIIFFSMVVSWRFMDTGHRKNESRSFYYCSEKHAKSNETRTLEEKSTRFASYKVRELRSHEEGEGLVLLYDDYYKRGDFDRKTFMDNWDAIRKNPSYHCLAVYKLEPTLPSQKPDGFLDFTIFQSLYHGRMIRVDACYVSSSNRETEFEIAKLLFQEAFSIAKSQRINRIIADTSEVYDQEIRLFSIFLGEPAIYSGQSTRYFSK